MNRIAFAALAAAAVLSGGAAASTDPPFHSCEGHVDYACNDPSGAFCTVWLSWRCTLGT